MAVQNPVQNCTKIKTVQNLPTEPLHAYRCPACGYDLWREFKQASIIAHCLKVQKPVECKLVEK